MVARSTLGEKGGVSLVLYDEVCADRVIS